MQRIKAFLIFNGAAMAVGAIFLLILYARRGNPSHFRDDLWEERKEAEKQGKLPEFEDKVDKKILLEHRPDPRDPKTEPAQAAAFKVPNFRGKPHEVLGIPANPNADLVNRAFKHWMKRYHPDRVTHLGKGYVDQARRRAEQLNTARQTLLAGIAKA